MRNIKEVARLGNVFLFSWEGLLGYMNDYCKPQVI